ncbi:hypothetical protein CO661_30860 [Sinorhizobium fredii]|uniref:Uncharacterized protein n=1 Tax=Rhizobium fredii TaxID=380 RepID=A0A2A6LP52_RHIFR|nr:hypothetical protein CO661_30860 [Sinorhizobium fredii]
MVSLFFNAILVLRAVSISDVVSNLLGCISGSGQSAVFEPIWHAAVELFAHRLNEPFLRASKGLEFDPL